MTETQEQFEALVDLIMTETDLLYDKEHDCIYEFFDEEIPLFKLIFSPPRDKEIGYLVVSFHVELDSPEAILWYQKLRGYDSRLHLTSSYYKDESGTYLGQDAHVAVRQRIEREVIASIKREAAKRKLKKNPTKAINLAATDIAEDALAAFDEWNPKKYPKSN